jgi:glycosyltransferase involved in cell wall biosynthesis
VRIGENPMKYSRRSSGKVTIPIKTSLPITACTIVYVPRLEGYYKEGLDVIKLAIYSLRANTKKDFDLIVFDNGSCQEVINWLIEQKDNNVIQWLFLSSENMKKIGAWNTLFMAAQGDYVYYFDSDIYHYEGWLEGIYSTLEAVSDGAIIGSFHNIPGACAKRTMKVLEGKGDYTAVRGNYFSDDKLRELAISLGSDEKKFIEKKNVFG